MATQLVISGNRILAHGEDCFLAMCGTVVCQETGKSYQNATVAIHDGGIPADIDKVGYEYHAGQFVPCAPFGFGDGDILVACEGDCGTPKRYRAKASEVIDQVGDIKVTARHSAGAEWLPCDGSVIDPEKYPELAKLCSPDIARAKLTAEQIFASSISGNNRVYCISYCEGYWIVGGARYDGTNTHACIAFSESLEGPWETVDLWSYAKEDQYNRIEAAAYHDGHFVVGGEYFSGSKSYARIAYATALDGGWTTKDLWSTNDTNGYANCIKCLESAEGHIVAGGTYNTGYARISYAAALDGEWTNKSLANSGNGEVSCIKYSGGYWVAGVTLYQNAGFGSAHVHYATALDGEWAYKQLWSDSNYNNQHLYDLTFAAGYWVIIGKYNSAHTIAYTESPDGAWAQETVSASGCIGYCQGYWIIGGGSAVYYTDDIAGEWQSNAVAGGTLSGINCICCAGFELAMGGNGSGYARLVRNTEKPALPIMANAYIKAL